MDNNKIFGTVISLAHKLVFTLHLRSLSHTIMTSIPNETDDVQLLLLHCGEILKEARFILSSIPNAEESSVERMLRKMHSVHKILAELDDPWITEADIDGLIALVLDVSGPLQKWLDSPRPSYQPPQCPKTPGRGRPRFDIDLDRAAELHDMELSWQKIATAMGISRRTLYTHFAAAGRSTARRPFTDITDNDLNEIVADISRRHPLSGSVVVRGHLEAVGIHVTLNRVKESLRTVDAIGVSLRCVFITTIFYFPVLIAMLDGAQQLSDVYTKSVEAMLFGTMMGMKNCVLGVFMSMDVLTVTRAWSSISSARTTRRRGPSNIYFLYL